MEQEARIGDVLQEAEGQAHSVEQAANECQKDEEVNPGSQVYPTLVIEETSHDDQAAEEEKSNVLDVIDGAPSQGVPESFSGDVPPSEEGSVVFSADQEDGGLPDTVDDRKISI